MTTIGYSPGEESQRVYASPRLSWTRRLLLASGIASAVYYAAITVFVATQWEGYSSTSQVISELSAIDAPTRTLWQLLCIPYTVLALAFGAGVWRSAGRSQSLRIAGMSIFAFGMLGVVAWPFAPMHLREVLAAGGATMSDTMHIALSGLAVLLMLVAIIAGSKAFGRWIQLYSIATLAILLLFGFLTFLESPGISSNTPTPWIGVWERINIGVFLLWESVIAVALLRRDG